MSEAVRIVLFCGGRGSATIIRALLRRTDVELTLIVNAYDDGLSTGALRSFIPGMLGPSDFRKNLSYLLGTWSHGQYALRSLMEYRLPPSITAVQIGNLAQFARDGKDVLPEPLRDWFAQLAPATAARMRGLLARFFDHAAGAGQPFDYRDCSLGNLVFAGAYLEAQGDFNAAAAQVGALVGSRARLLNVSDVQNRILVGLKRDGQYLASEAEVVGAQSPEPITGLYFLEQPLEPALLDGLDAAGRASLLATRESVPGLSAATAQALAQADILLYGPGTQHSSLLPSYRIAAAALRTAPAPVKAMIVNLDGDNDIQGLSASDLVDRAIAHGAPVNHVLYSRTASLPPGGLNQNSYRGASVVRGVFATLARPHSHNGGAVADAVLNLWRRRDAPAEPVVEIFADIHNRSVASDELVEEFIEMDWNGLAARLVLNQPPQGALPQGVSTAPQPGLFPEAAHLQDWLLRGDGDYLVLMTGDGAYRFADVLAIIRLLEQQPSLGGVFGSRTQSRRQFITSIQAAYGEHRFLYRLGKAAAFFLSLVFYLRTGIIFSDPLTGLRIFRRRHIAHLTHELLRGGDAPLAIVRLLVRHSVEVAELPVLYRTFAGFTDPYWRMRRGLRNLASLVGL